MPLIYRKTPKGTAEIETRAHGLRPRARSTLILVNGKRDVDDVCALVAQPSEDLLIDLAAGGFIEAVGETIRLTEPATP
jgi:hypothetical protein